MDADVRNGHRLGPRGGALFCWVVHDVVFRGAVRFGLDTFDQLAPFHVDEYTTGRADGVDTARQVVRYVPEMRYRAAEMFTLET